MVSSREPTVPLSTDQREAFHEGTIVSGTETREADIDVILYE